MPFNHVKVPHRHQGTSRRKIRGAMLIVALLAVTAISLSAIGMNSKATAVGNDTENVTFDRRDSTFADGQQKGDVLVASHADISDEGQSVTARKPVPVVEQVSEKITQTGSSLSGVAVFGGIAAVCGIAMLIARKNRR